MSKLTEILSCASGLIAFRLLLIKEWLSALPCRLLGHAWKETGWNAWGIDTENRCRRCGAYRHHFFRDRRGIFDEPEWRVGRHPGKGEA